MVKLNLPRHHCLISEYRLDERVLKEFIWCSFKGGMLRKNLSIRLESFDVLKLCLWHPPTDRWIGTERWSSFSLGSFSWQIHKQHIEHNLPIVVKYHLNNEFSNEKHYTVKVLTTLSILSFLSFRMIQNSSIADLDKRTPATVHTVRSHQTLWSVEFHNRVLAALSRAAHH